MFQGPWILPWGGVVNHMPSPMIQLIAWCSRRVPFCVWRTKSLLQIVSRNRIKHGGIFCLFGQRRWQTLTVSASKRSELDWINSFPKASYTPEGFKHLLWNQTAKTWELFASSHWHRSHSRCMFSRWCVPTMKSVWWLSFHLSPHGLPVVIPSFGKDIKNSRTTEMDLVLLYHGEMLP